MLIVIDGSDGMGKTTQVDRAVAYLRNLLGDDRVVQTKEPGGTQLGMALRRVMFEEVPAKTMAPGVVDLLFLASHIQNWRTVVKPALEAGKVVVSDRWHESSVAYMSQREVPVPIFDAYEKCRGDNPSLFIFLYGDVRVGIDRARARRTETHQSTKPWDDYAQMSKIQEEYFSQFSHLDEWHPIRVDHKDQETVWFEIKAAIDEAMREYANG